MSTIEINPTLKEQPFSDNYKLLIGSIIPRPIAVVSTLNEDGTHNIAPFSFFTAVSAKPMIIAFSPMIRTSTGEQKDTLININRSLEFTVNFVHEEIAQKINLTATELPYGEDEFKYAGLTAVESKIIKAPRLLESKINFECKLKEVVSFGSDVGTGSLVLGEVVYVHVDSKIYDEGRILDKEYNAVGRSSGANWVRTQDTFELERLTAKIHQ